MGTGEWLRLSGSHLPGNKMAGDRFVYSAILFFKGLSTIMNRQSMGEFCLPNGPDLLAVHFYPAVSAIYIQTFFELT